MRDIVFMTALVLMVIIVVANIKVNDDLTVELEQKEQKIEMLQEENANLHDDVWNLNNQLMKGDE